MELKTSLVSAVFYVDLSFDAHTCGHNSGNITSSDHFTSLLTYLNCTVSRNKQPFKQPQKQ